MDKHDFKEAYLELIKYERETKLYEGCTDGSYEMMCSYYSNALHKLKEELEGKSWSLTYSIYKDVRQYDGHSMIDVEIRDRTETITGTGFIDKLFDITKLKGICIDEFKEV